MDSKKVYSTRRPLNRTVNVWKRNWQTKMKEYGAPYWLGIRMLARKKRLRTTEPIESGVYCSAINGKCGFLHDF